MIKAIFFHLNIAVNCTLDPNVASSTTWPMNITWTYAEYSSQYHVYSICCKNWWMYFNISHTFQVHTLKICRIMWKVARTAQTPYQTLLKCWHRWYSPNIGDCIPTTFTPSTNISPVLVTVLPPTPSYAYLGASQTGIPRKTWAPTIITSIWWPNHYLKF